MPVARAVVLAAVRIARATDEATPAECASAGGAYAGGICCVARTKSGSGSPASQSVDLGSLGLVPPFRIVM